MELKGQGRGFECKIDQHPYNLRKRSERQSLIFDERRQRRCNLRINPQLVSIKTFLLAIHTYAIVSMCAAYHVKITVMDLKLEDNQIHIPMADITTELRLGTRSMHTCNMATAKDGTPVATPVPLSSQISNERITFVCKAKGLAENIGSVSIPQFIILNGGLNTYEQWITLFEHEEDDEYDGEMGLNDDEEPMLQIKFEICQDEKPKTSASSAKTTSSVTKTMTTTTTTS